MNIPTTSVLLCALATLACTSCSKGPGDDPEPIAGGTKTQGQSTTGGEDNGGDSSGKPSSTDDSGLAGRIRLPNMEDLPTERELTPNDKPDTGSSGVIARPPSEE